MINTTQKKESLKVGIGSSLDLPLTFLSLTFFHAVYIYAMLRKLFRAWNHLLGPPFTGWLCTV